MGGRSTVDLLCELLRFDTLSVVDKSVGSIVQASLLSPCLEDLTIAGLFNASVTKFNTRRHCLLGWTFDERGQWLTFSKRVVLLILNFTAF